MTNTLPAYLPLTQGLEDLLRGMYNDSRNARYHAPGVISRARKFELVEGPKDAPGLSTLGMAVATMIDQHSYSTGHNHPGRIGTKGRCRCGDWSWGTNEGGYDGQRRVRNAFASHLAELISEYLVETSPAVIAAEGYETH